MIILTKEGNRTNLPPLFAEDEGVWCFNFYGDETFIDTYDSSVWTWEWTDLSLEEVLGVTQDDGRQLAIATSLSDCKALQGSFYWDNANGVLYVHWFESVGDWSISRTESSYSQIVGGYANKYSDTTQNVWDGIYFEQILTELSGLSKSVDPTKLGMIAFNQSSYSLCNEDGRFDSLDATQVTGVPTWFYRVPDDAEVLTNDMRIFTGFKDGYQNDFSKITYNTVESRFFENKPTCPNSITLTDYANAGEMEGKTIPVAFGDIRRGVLMPTNLDSLTEANPGTAQFLVADPSLYAVLAISKLYDKDENELTITGTNLTNCTVEYTKPAGVAPNDLKDYKWEGQGYDIDGTYNNGLDIIRACFLKLANIPYIASTYNIPEYGQGILDNTQPVGISIATDRGFIESVIAPITTSLQGIVDIQGDGRITWRSRDDTRPVLEEILINDLFGEPKIVENTQETVSELTINYAPDFTDRKKDLTYNYSDKKSEVISNYGINRKTPLSPVQTILFAQSDAEDIAEEIMETSDQPSREITGTTVEYIEDAKLFDIIGIDTGRYGSENLEYGEILNITPDYFNDRQRFTIRTIDDPVFRPLPSSGSILKDFILKDDIMGPPVNPYNEGEL